MLSVRAHSYFLQNYEKGSEWSLCNDKPIKKRKISWVMPGSKKIATHELLGSPLSRLPNEDLPNFLLYIDNLETTLLNLKSFDRMNLPTFPMFHYTIIGSSIRYNSQLITVGHTDRRLIIEKTNLLTFKKERLCQILINVEHPIVYVLASIIHGDDVYIVDKHNLRIYNLEKRLWSFNPFAKWRVNYSFGLLVMFEDKLYVFEEIGFTKKPIACMVLDRKNFIVELSHSYSPYFRTMVALTAFIYRNKICVSGIIIQRNWQDHQHGTRIVSYHHETKEWTNVCFIQHVGDVIIVNHKMLLIEWCTNDLFEYDPESSVWILKSSASEFEVNYEYIPRYSNIRSAFTATQCIE